MKKCLLALLLAVAMVVPVFATEKGDIEIVGKLGVAVNPTIVWCYDEDEGGGFGGYDKNPALSIAVEGFYYIFPELPIGLGVNYQFNSDITEKISGASSKESGVTNIYLTVKPTAKIDSKSWQLIRSIDHLLFFANTLEQPSYFSSLLSLH